MRKRTKTMIVGLVLVAAGIISIFFIDWNSEVVAEPPVVRPLKTMVIESAVARGMREYPASINASQRVDLAFRVAGPLMELPVNAGQAVAAGDVLARIDPRDFRIRLDQATSKIEEAQANLAAMRGGRPEDIAKLEAEVQKADAAHTLAVSEYETTKKAFDRGAVTDSQLKQLLETRQRCEAELEQAQRNLEIGKVGARQEDIDAAEALIRGLVAQRNDAQAALEDTDLRAPFAGHIARRYVENFEFVDVRQPILSLQDVSNVEVVINVPQADLLTRTTRGEYLAFAVFEGAPDQRFELALKEFSTEADSATQTYEVAFIMPAPAGLNVLSGMTAAVRVYPKATDNSKDVAFAVPLDAVPVDGQGQYYVWKLSQESNDVWAVHRADVEVGDLIGNTVVITSGLALGDRIAIAGVHVLREGQEVRLLEPGSSKR